MNLNPHDITPPHGVRTPALLSELVADMRENGWHGRPLLVIETESGYQAWTGSHRIAAACEANLSVVPCYVVPEKLIVEHGVYASWGHVDDTDRLNIIRKVGDETAIRLMWLEGRQ